MDVVEVLDVLFRSACPRRPSRWPNASRPTSGWLEKELFRTERDLEAAIESSTITSATLTVSQGGSVIPALTLTTPQLWRDKANRRKTGVSNEGTPALSLCPVYGMDCQQGLASVNAMLYT